MKKYNTPDLFQLKPAPRRLNKKERKWLYDLARWFLKEDMSKPDNPRLLSTGISAMEKIKPIKRNK